MVSTAQAQVLASATACCIFAAIAMILRKRGGYVVATWRQDWDDLSGGYNGACIYYCMLFYIYIYNIHTYYCVLLSRKPITMCLIFVCMLWMMPCLHNFGSYKQCWHMVPGPLQAVRPVAADHVPAEGVPWSNFVPYVMYTSGSSAIIGNVSKTIINHIHPYPKSPLPTL